MWEALLTEALKPLGLTTRKLGLLGHIRRTPDISFSELARHSGITVQSAHGAAALLDRAAVAVAEVDARFVEQHPALAEALRDVRPPGKPGGPS